MQPFHLLYDRATNRSVEQSGNQSSVDIPTRDMHPFVPVKLLALHTACQQRHDHAPQDILVRTSAQTLPRTINLNNNRSIDYTIHQSIDTKQKKTTTHATRHARVPGPTRCTR